MFSHCKMIRQVIEEEKIDSVLSSSTNILKFLQSNILNICFKPNVICNALWCNRVCLVEHPNISLISLKPS